MREILFRGMKEDGKWVEGGYCNGYEQVEQVLDFVDGCRQCLHHYIAVDAIVNRGLSNKMLLYDVLPETIGQYTGLCDKSGTKIFEGDIVTKEDKYCKMYGVISFGRHSPTTAELGEVGFYIKWVDDNSNLWSEWIRNDLGFWVDNGVEVIGNIHENKELLEG